MQRLIPASPLPGAAAPRWLVAVLLWLSATTVYGQLPFDDESPELLPGLVAHYQGGTHQPPRRIDEQLSFVWPPSPAESRLDSHTVTAAWSGQLFARPSGAYRLHVFLHGRVAIDVDGATVLEATSDQPRWFISDEVDWSAGYHPFHMTYTRSGPAGRLGVYWTGPGFSLEPIPATALWHEPSETASEARRTDRGRQLVDALRCVACHQIPTAPPLLPAPSLERLHDHIEPAWLVAQLQDHAWLGDDEPPGEGSSTKRHLSRNMPRFGFGRRTARDVAAALLSSSAGEPSAAPADQHAASDPPSDPDPRAGEQLLLTVGCLACHTYRDLGQASRFGGGDLTAIAAKRPAGFFARWLSDPASINPQHRMPVFQLSAEERADLAAFLQTLRGEGGDGTGDDASLAQADVAAGREAISQARCAACHALPPALAVAVNRGEPTTPIRTPLTEQPDWQQGCIAASGPSDQHPAYRLTASETEAVKQYVASVASTLPTETLTARDQLQRSQCLACHRRGSGSGNSEAALAIAERHSDAVAHVAALIPPSLDSVGDKLRDESLREAIAGKADPQRPWLRVRMPRFPMSDMQVEQLATELTVVDRIPAVVTEAAGGEPTGSAAAVGPPPSEAVRRTVGARLVTSSGFGCTSCHPIGGVQPAEAPISSLGPDLRELGQRIRPEWFKRWVADPLRIVPRVEMPAIAAPVSGVLDEQLEHQIDAVWHALNLPDFAPPKPNPVRVVRKQGRAEAGERAAVITDVLYQDEQEFIKPLLVGLPNRQNILIDLAEARVAGWWSGDVAHQRTEGKRWFWESPGGNIWPDAAGGEDLPNAASEWLLVRGDGENAQRLQPQRRGQFLTEFDRWEHTADGGVRFSHRLHFGDPASDAPVVIIEQTIAPRWTDSQAANAAWSREIRASGLAADWRLLHRPLPRISNDDGSGLQVRVAEGSRAAIDAEGWVEVAAAAESPQRETSLRLEYAAQIPIDTFAATATAEAREEALRLEVVPGFNADQLPLPREIMPTAFGWHPNGSLYVTDLKGTVWHVSDSDADGSYDASTIFMDGLAAPFGIAAHDGYVDVINKYALLRLWDDDNDRAADRVEALASGWGHTADYHDWAVGLVQAADGSYLVTLSCQQDQRSEAAAHLRGAAVRLRPRRPTPTQPQRYAVERVTGGHRFPIGVAQDRDGEIYVTDNQGNYKPFNELNRIVPGAHYGFINLLERQDSFVPERTPPTIEIPHPWTRSVNGICFLNTPRGAVTPRFGPFEGHLIGCEYDTRRLVRMSLQKVGDDVQGAVYPFTYDAPLTGPPLLGPISCGVSPRGELFVGNLRESGWGAGANVGNLVRLRLDPSNLPAGIAEVRATADGFEILLTQEVDPGKAVDASRFAIASYTRAATPQYGGDDQQRRTEKIRSITYDAQRRMVAVELAELRENFVYEFQLQSLVGEDEAFYPAEAFYTLRKLIPAKAEGNKE